MFTREQINQVSNSVYSIPAAQREMYFKRILQLLEGNVGFSNRDLMQAIQQAQREMRSGAGLAVSAA
jgi:hypothetical protein